MTRTIIASGGGLIESGSLLQNAYLLAQTQKPHPKVLLIPTASGDHKELISFFLSLWSKYPCDPSVLSFFHGSVPDLQELILQQDLILVSGGNTKSMLGVWREWGLDRVLKQAYQQGIVLAGGSAGGVCWFNTFLTDAFAGRFHPCVGLEFLPFSCCPHYSLKSRREAYKTEILDGQLGAGYAITDHAALHFQNEQFFRGISDLPNQSAHFIEQMDGKLKTTRLPVQSIEDPEIYNQLLTAPCFSNLSSNPEEKIETTDV